MGLFTSKSKKLLEEGALAQAVLKSVRDTGVTINNNPQVKLIFDVQPEGGEPFEASLKKTVSRVQIPQPGMTVFVRYDPANRTKIVLDTRAVDTYNATAEAHVDEARALAVPADLAAHGIPGRAMIKNVTRLDSTGALIHTRLTASIRLIDGSAPYETTFTATLAPDTVTALSSTDPIVPMAVRVDPVDHSRAALSPSEAVPVVPYDNPPALEAPARALREGVPRRVTLVELQRQYLRVPGGDEVYTVRGRLEDGTNVLAGVVPVPPDAQWLMKEGSELPARALASQPDVLMVDWDLARREAGAGAVR